MRISYLSYSEKHQLAEEEGLQCLFFLFLDFTLEEQLQDNLQDRVLVAVHDLPGSCKEHTKNSKHLDLLLHCPCQKKKKIESGTSLQISDSWAFCQSCHVEDGSLQSFCRPSFMPLRPRAPRSLCGYFSHRPYCCPANFLHVDKLTAEDCLPPSLPGYLMSPGPDPACLDSLKMVVSKVSSRYLGWQTMSSAPGQLPST